MKNKEIDTTVCMIKNTMMEANESLMKEDHPNPHGVVMAAMGFLVTEFLKEMKDGGHPSYRNLYDLVMTKLIKMEYGVDAPFEADKKREDE